MSDTKECDVPDCPGEQGWEMGFGLAGGGYGAYQWCPLCEKIIEKWQEPTE